MNPSHEATIDLLIKLNNGETLDINKYLTGFYNAINRYNFYLARTYLNILIELEKLGFETNVNNLTSFLLETESKCFPEAEEHIPTPVDYYINSVLEEMEANNSIAAIIDITDEEERGALYGAPNHKILSFGETKVLIEEEIPSGEIDYTELRNQAIRLFKAKDYKNSAALFEQLIKLACLPNIYMARYFKYLGICYYNSGAESLAKEYLTISDKLFAHLNTPSGLDDYLLTLNDSPDDKPSFIMNLEEFDYNYEISSLEELSSIAHLIIGTDLDIEETCNSYGLDEEDLTYIYILIAREYFKEGNIPVGNKYLDIASQRNNKTEKALELINFLKTNKRFIQNRKNKELVLS